MSFTLYAKWEDATTYEVQFNLTGGTVHPNAGDITQAPANQYIVSGSKANNPPVPISNGYAFRGWFIDDTFTTAYNFNTVVTEAKTIYGKWELVTYTITYNVNKGTWVDGYTKPESWTWTTANSVALPGSANITRTHYTFGGWYRNSNLTEQVTTLNGLTTNLILYASGL